MLGPYYLRGFHVKQGAEQRAVLLANGILEDVGYAHQLLREDDWIVAANGGTRVAAELGIVPQLLVGDSDSLPASLQQWLTENAVPHLPFARAKDETDLELALWHVAEHGVRSVLVLGAIGGRTDHSIANLSLLAAAARRGMRIEAVAGREHLFVIAQTLTLDGNVGDIVSLLPWGGDAGGVTTQGLRWALESATLPFGTTRGISNEMIAAIATISLEAGLLLVAHHR